MKKNTKKNLSNNVAKYGALSLAIAGVADASGQVVYTDLDPDFVAVSAAGTDPFYIDFNADGTDDLRMIYGLVGGAGEAFTAINNEMLEVSGLTVGSLVGNYTYALNLDEGDMISAGTGDFGNVGSLCYLDGIAGTFCGDGNNTPDGFAGVAFQIDGNTHYGWVGFEGVTADGFTVTDFAYESTPDTAIAAGDQGALNTPEQNLLAFSFFVDANNTLNISNRVAMNNITVFDITGKQVMTQTIGLTEAQINLGNLNTGVYIGKVSIEGAEKSFKFVKK
ncbi:hypothetical protein ULMS_24490 [Patiriisocius marinistellae]|uniref:Secretion system C-terminal sorting domain-containing protein n=1 Tax=Patiriisocius marinistellae TaxID=2494560 RepID=A0A5J4G3J3_9FLAO|nr:T9SS type A sorting domain-containing protein [Patiriisocius marinistellae]GEQ86941.1 hypothetical protein ULMS_24490 [Patiriisocius marinistellae]